MVSNAAEFFAIASLKRDKVDVSGNVVHIRELSVRERSELLDLVDKSPSLAPAFLVRTCVTDEEGKALFSDADTDAVADLAPSVIDAVAAAVMKISGMRDDPND